MLSDLPPHDNSYPLQLVLVLSGVVFGKVLVLMVFGKVLVLMDELDDGHVLKNVRNKCFK